MNDNTTSQRTALVTGSTSGIGKAIAIKLASEGIHVMITGRDKVRGLDVVTSIKETGGKADFVYADVNESASIVRSLVKQTTNILGGHIDILINNVGIYPVGPTADVADETIDMMLNINLRSTHILVSEIAPAMVEHKSGVIVNIGSWMGSTGIGFSALYSGTKAAIEEMSRCWAAEYGPLGVRVNAIAPGAIYTEGNADGKAAIAQMTASIPAGRAGTPLDIANAVSFLVSDEAAYIHAATLAVDGGIANTYA